METQPIMWCTDCKIWTGLVRPRADAYNLSGMEDKARDHLVGNSFDLAGLKNFGEFYPRKNQ